MSTAAPTHSAHLSAGVFLADSHAAKYRDMVDRESDAFDRVLQILNERGHELQMLTAARMGHAPLQGIVSEIEHDPEIARTLASPSSRRFRQAVGVAIRLKMGLMGWTTSGRKGSIRQASFFTRAEKYNPPTGDELNRRSAERARAALDAIKGIGDEDERATTGGDLMAALAASRRSEKRPF